MSNSHLPIVSILTCAFNSANYIAETIHSVLAQTFQDFELIIVNDGSTDETGAVVKSFQDPRIIYVEQANLTLGIKPAHWRAENFLQF